LVETGDGFTCSATAGTDGYWTCYFSSGNNPSVGETLTVTATDTVGNEGQAFGTITQTPTSSFAG